jgi:DNA-binding response OmpR family regulator
LLWGDQFLKILKLTTSKEEITMPKILVIEDEKGYMKNICLILEKEGYAIIKAEDGTVGVEMARNHQPDLILCDIVMPKKFGFDVIKELKEDSVTSEIPVIFLTTFENDDNIVKCLELGAHDFVSKTTDNRVLLARVRTHIELRKKNRTLQKIVDELYHQLNKPEKEKQIKEEMQLLISKINGDIESLHEVIKKLIDLKDSH